jgi:hypothetical protein
MPLAEIELRRRPACECADRNLRRQLPYSIKHGSNRVDATTQPAHGAGQAYIGAAQYVGGSFNALRCGRDNDGILHFGKQARQPGGKEVGQ